MHALITGGCGFVGSHFCEHLLANTDWRITVLDGLTYAGDPARLYDAGKFDHTRIRIFWHDLNAPIMDTLARRIGDVDYIVNAASNSHIDNSIADPVPFVKNNVNVALHMLEYARRLDDLKAFVQIETDEIYGSVTAGQQLAEWAPINPSNPYCVHPLSEVITPAGRRTIDCLRVGDEVLSLVGTQNKFCPVTAISIRTCQDEFMELRHSWGAMRVSEEHRVFAWRPKRNANGRLSDSVNFDESDVREFQARDIRKGDFLIVARSIPDYGNPGLPELYRFLGFFVANGNLKETKTTRQRHVITCSGHQNVMRFYQELVARVFGNVTQHYKHGSKECWYHQFTNKMAWDFLTGAGKGALNKNCMDTLLMNKDCARAFLAGFFDGDGSFSGQVVSFASISRPLLDDCVMLLRRCGILATVGCSRSRDNVLWRISITDSTSIRRFQALIPQVKHTITTEAKAQGNLRGEQFVFSTVTGIDRVPNVGGQMFDIEVSEAGNFYCDYTLVHNSASKAAMSCIAISYWRTYGIPLVLVAPMNNFGERQDREKFVPKCVRAISAGEEIVLHGTRDNIGSRYYLHARNTSDAILFLLRRQPSIYPNTDRPDRYNIVGDRRVDNLEMARKITDILKLPLRYRFEHNPRSRPGHDLHYGLDGSKLAALGWRPPVDFESSLERTVKWTKENPLW